MADFKNQTFTDQTIDLDGNGYSACTFVGCTLRFSGGGGVQRDGCRFERCNLALDGAAANTIGYLTSIHAGLGDWGRTTVANLCATIQGGTPTKPPAG